MFGNLVSAAQAAAQAAMSTLVPPPQPQQQQQQQENIGFNSGQRHTRRSSARAVNPNSMRAALAIPPPTALVEGQLLINTEQVLAAVSVL